VQLFDESYLSTVTDTLSGVIKKIEIDYLPKMMKVNDEAIFTLNSSPWRMYRIGFFKLQWWQSNRI